LEWDVEGPFIEGTKGYLVVRIDKENERFIRNNKLPTSAIFYYGYYKLTENAPPTLKKLCKAFNINEKVAKELFLILIEKLVKERQNLSSLVVYLLGRGKISMFDIARGGGASPPTLVSMLKDLGLSGRELKSI